MYAALMRFTEVTEILLVEEAVRLGDLIILP
jgi:hypothetical protein